MNILINGQKADITLDAEKTVGDVLAGIEQWLAGSLYRLSGLVIDGETAGSESMDAAFVRELAGISTLEIFTSNLADLAAQGIERLCEDIAVYEAAGFEEKRNFFARWSETPQARILAEQEAELYSLCENVFSAQTASAGVLRAIAEERLREFRKPLEELVLCGRIVAEICERLTGLPLDIQTGKDARAAETIQLFSNIAGKILRVYALLKTEGFVADNAVIEEGSAGSIPLAAYIDEFGAALKELLAAYQQKDAVLVGDLSEYELAPRLRLLYDTIVQGASGNIGAFDKGQTRDGYV